MEESLNDSQKEAAHTFKEEDPHGRKPLPYSLNRWKRRLLPEHLAA
jgi:hypothetical protein